MLTVNLSVLIGLRNSTLWFKVFSNRVGQWSSPPSTLGQNHLHSNYRHEKDTLHGLRERLSTEKQAVYLLSCIPRASNSTFCSHSSGPLCPPSVGTKSEQWQRFLCVGPLSRCLSFQPSLPGRKQLCCFSQADVIRALLWVLELSAGAGGEGAQLGD